MIRAAISATGHYLPPDVYPNVYFDRRLETTDEWSRSPTGIAERRVAQAGGTSGLIIPAARHGHVCHMGGEGGPSPSVDSVAKRLHSLVHDGPAALRAAVIGRLVPHHAHRRIIEAVATRPRRQFTYGDRRVLSAFGAGFTSGSVCLPRALA